jgi:hypothetical protein
VGDNGDNVSHGGNILAELEHFHPGDHAVDRKDANELADPKRSVFVAVEG